MKESVFESLVNTFYTVHMYISVCLFLSTMKLKSPFQSINKLKNPTHLRIRFTWFELNWRVGQSTSLIFGHVIQNLYVYIEMKYAIRAQALE